MTILALKYTGFWRANAIIGVSLPQLKKPPPPKPQLSQARDASETFITCDERLSTNYTMRVKVMRPSIIKFHHFDHFHLM